MYQDSIVYKFIKNSGFPIINRQDRSIYEKQQWTIDPAMIMRRAANASIVGYFVGKKIGNKDVIFCLGFGAAVVLGHLLIDLKLKSEGKYQNIYRPTAFQTHYQGIQNQVTQQIPKIKQDVTITNSYFTPKPPLKTTEFLTIKQLVDSLPRQYFV